MGLFVIERAFSYWGYLWLRRHLVMGLFVVIRVVISGSI